MRKSSKQQRELDQKLETIRRELHWASIYVDQKNYEQAGISAKCAVQLLGQVDAACQSKTPKEKTTASA